MKSIENIKDIQNVLFATLCYFDDFCSQHGIKYFLSNGTLLGAAKYKGFIPWDDDVDVLLPREDYDKLVSLKEINSDQYRLLCREQVPTWRMPYAKLSCENTVIQEGAYDFGAQFGVSVDIFPIDKWSPWLPIAKFQAFKCECLKRLLVCSIGGAFNTQKTGVKRFILKTIWLTGKSLGHERVLRAILQTANRSHRNPKKYMGCLCWTCHLHKEIFPESFFEKTDRLMFCGRSFRVFAEYEKYLDSLYGNWRAELPVEQQHSNHDIKVWWKNAE